MLRTHTNGELRIEHAGTEVTLCGWVQRSRDKGGMIWVDLRDRYGVTQLMLEEGKSSAEALALARGLGREFVVEAKGIVVERLSKNDKMPTGDIEIKVKELTVGAKTCLSMQKHKDRAEHWFVAEGTATVYTLNAGTDMDLVGNFNKFESLHISREQWHKLCNETDQPLRVIEIQYGENCIEEDIERK